MKGKMFLVALVVISLALVGCEATNENMTVKFQQDQYSKNQPIPQFDFSIERDIYIQLYQARNETIVTYTVVMTQYGKVVFECPSLGYPMAADTHLVNPLVVTSSGATVEQPEPNGLYSSKNTAGTWVLCVLEDGTIYPYYTEVNANTWPFPVRWDETTQKYVQVENTQPTNTIEIGGQK